jgi:MarR family transcriptional regulator, lower aerobic nicotinate degradation pathway regulator
MTQENLFPSMPGHLIRRAYQIAVAIFMEECAAQNLTPVQFACLAEISSHPGVDATRLATAVAVDRSTLGNVLARMEAKGWIARRPSPHDKRIKLLHPTAEAAPLLESVSPGVDVTQQRILAPLTEEERTTFLRLLERLVDGNNQVSRAPLDLQADVC